MPGPYIHIAAADAIARALVQRGDWHDMPLDLAGLSPDDVTGILDGNQSYYSLGAIGPDLFYFLPDFRSVNRVVIANPLIQLVHWLDETYKKLDDHILALYVESFGGPLGEDLTEQISRFTGDLSTTVAKISSEFASIAIVGLEDTVTQAHDWFELFSLGLNHGFDNQDYLWSDMLHYRRTGAFAQTLWESASAGLAGAKERLSNANAAGDDMAAEEAADEITWALRKQAYALGYMTHVATDVAGHPFVNEKCGGPYRTHWQRHHLVENHMDADAFDVDHGKQRLYKMLTESALHYRIAFTDEGESTPRTLPEYDPEDQTLQKRYIWRRQLDLDSEMPDELAEYIVDALQMYTVTLGPGVDPLPYPTDSSPHVIQNEDGRPAPSDVQDAYLWLFRYLKHVTVDGFAHDKPKPPDVFPNWQWPILTDPHSEAPGEEDAKIDWHHHRVLFILKVILVILLWVVWIVSIIPALAADLITYIPRLIAYYAIELPLYHILKFERSILVATGYMLPMRDEIDRGLVEIGHGSPDNFLALLSGMDALLGDLRADLLDAMNDDTRKLMEDLGITAEEAAAIVLAASGSKRTPPSEPAPDDKYPHAHDDDTEFHHPWDYPKTPSELPKTKSGPYRTGSRAHVLLDGTMSGDAGTRRAFEQAKDPATADQIAIDAMRNLGDPIGLGQYLVWQYTRDDFPSDSEISRIADWNLDADRGYGYRCWDWNRFAPPGEGEARDPSHHVFVDADGHQFLQPCTSPPQSDPPLPKYNSTGPLDTHFADETDPRCE
jgi:hypothetical protein